MKKIWVGFILVLCVVFSGCVEPEEEADGKLLIVSAVFPGYDFARQVCGNDAEVVMLIRPGMESHSYEPSPQDMILLERCDLFIYAGGESDVWIQKMLEAVRNEKLRTISMLDCVEPLEEEWIEGMQGEAEEEPELDEHVWTDPMNAAMIAKEIGCVAAELDEAHEAEYKKNAEVYEKRMIELDRQLKEIVENSERKTLIFADRFPMRYFTHRYGLEYYAAFAGCSHETEPSAQTLAFLIDQVRYDELPVVLKMDLSDGKTARVVCEETGAIERTFYSGHTVTAEELSQGVTYEDLMRRNLEVLKEALG